jgi:IS1 family transposase
MNVLTPDLQAAVLRALVEGNSMRSTSRMTGVARNTIANLLRDVGAHCKNHHDRFVRDVAPERVQLDEIWSFVNKKEKNVPRDEKGRGEGDAWTWVALDPDSKMVLSYRTGSRDSATGFAFVQDLADRLTARVQITSDGFPIYERAIRDAFDWKGPGVDYGRIVKIYGNLVGAGRYSPPKLIAATKESVLGSPDEKHISTSLVERQNLHMRMAMRRFTRLTNAFSKKLEYHMYAIALHYTYYNYCRPHGTLSKAAGKPTTPAMAAGLAVRPWSIEDILSLLQGK